MDIGIVFLVFVSCVGSSVFVDAQILTDENKTAILVQTLSQKQYQLYAAKLYDVGNYTIKRYGEEESQIIAGALFAILESDAGKGVVNLLLEKFNEAYNNSNLSTWNATFLMQNLNDTSLLISKNFDVIGTAQELLRLSDIPLVADYLPVLKNAIDYVERTLGENGTQLLVGSIMKALGGNGSAQNGSNLLSNQSQNQNILSNTLSNFDALGTIKGLIDRVSVQFALPYTQSSNIRQDCYEDTMDVLDAVKEMDKNQWAWARTIFDATGKLPSGVLKGKMSMLGSYDQCMENNVHISANTVLGGRSKTSPKYPRSFKTTYCRATLTIPASILGNIDTKGVNPIATLGLCMPSTCNAKDVKNMLQLGYLKSLTSSIPTLEDVKLHCVENKSITDDSSAIVAIAILSFFVFFLVVGTLLTLYNSWKNQSQQQSVLQNGNMPRSPRENIYTVPSDKQQSSISINGEPKHYSSVNGIQSKGSSHQNGDTQGFTDGKTNIGDLPSGYMHHREGAIYAPGSDKHQIGTENNREEGKGGLENTHKTLPEVHVDMQHNDNREKQVVPTNTPQSKIRHGPVYNFLACFSAEIHAPKILSGNSGHGAITCLHGIRFFSITWIMLGHTYNYGLITNPGVFTIENFVDAIPMIQRFTYQGVVGAGFSVDTFYMISGMLLSYIQIKQMFKLKKNPKPANVGYYVFYYYFHRFWRLTPMYMAVLLIFAGLFPYLGNGPMWPEGYGPAENCRQNWWTNLLYVNNLVKVDGMCMGWSWFLANDMQFYVVSIVLLFFLTLNLALGSLIIFLLLAAGVASAGWKEHIYNGSFFTMRSDDGAFWNNVYITPWCRVAAFCVGMLLGVIMYRKPKYNIGRGRAFVGWCLAIAFGLGLVYCTYSENKKDGEPWSRDFRAAYESLGRPLWAACVAWVVFACHHGYGGIVDSLLSWKGLVPLSRLSYAAYLVHPILMMVHVYSKRNLVYLNDYEIIYLFLGHTVLTFMTAFVVSLLFEAPFMALEKLFIGKRR